MIHLFHGQRSNPLISSMTLFTIKLSSVLSIKNRIHIVRLIFIQALFIFCQPAQAQVTTLSKAVFVSDHQQAFIPRPEQDALAQKKLIALEKKTGRKPNIVWLVIDDMGYGDPGCFGGGAAIGAATPNMDRLAREGLKLTSVYSQPTCTPTRSAILTGRLPARTGLTRPILAGDKLTVNPWQDEISLAKILSANNYKTVLSGKWHIGELDGMKPFEIGFDEYQGFYAAEKEVSQAFDKRRYPDLTLDSFKRNAYNKIGASADLVYGKKGGQEQIVIKTTGVNDIAEADERIKDFSVQKIREFAKSRQPFFLEHCFMKVHADVFASKKYEGKSDSKYPYKDGIVEVDALIGEIVAELDKNGLLENTIIFITSDNGPQTDSWPDAGYTPFRGSKSSTWEGGVRVPGIVYWKGMISPGRESSGIFDLMDLFNTSLNIAGASGSLPQDRYIDGIDQTSFLLADNGESKRDRVYLFNGLDLMAFRLHEYKMHFKYTLDSRMNANIDQSTIYQTGLAPWLFNLYTSPKEEITDGHVLNAWTASVAAEARSILATFKKFPPKKIGLGE